MPRSGVPPAGAAGQPLVDWSVRVEGGHTGQPCRADGFVEIGWSHGRFSGHPEAPHWPWPSENPGSPSKV